LPQPGQALGGLTTDSPRGTRQMTTLRNEPIISPTRPQDRTRARVTSDF
jgi:hypothetical protein